MTPRNARARVHRVFIGGKDISPAPLFVGVGILALQGVGQIDGAITLDKVMVMQRLSPSQLFLSGSRMAFREWAKDDWS